MLLRRLRGDREAETDTKSNSCDGWGGIGYDKSPSLMERMSVMLVEFEKTEMAHVLFFHRHNRMDEPLSTVVTRMLCVFISAKQQAQAQQAVVSILRKFVAVLDFKWVLALCNQDRLNQHRELVCAEI